MKLYAYSVFDKSVGAFLAPFFSRAKGEAIRSFTDACNDGQHQFCRHAEDYALFEVAHFDDTSGILELPPAGPVRVITAMECVRVVDKTT